MRMCCPNFRDGEAGAPVEVAGRRIRSGSVGEIRPPDDRVAVQELGEVRRIDDAGRSSQRARLASMKPRTAGIEGRRAWSSILRVQPVIVVRLRATSPRVSSYAPLFLFDSSACSPLDDGRVLRVRRRVQVRQTIVNVAAV